MKFSETITWKNYDLFHKVINRSSSTRSTIDALILWKILKEFKPIKCLEVGIFQGLTSGLLLETLPDSTLVGIDPYPWLDVFESIYPTEVKSRFKLIVDKSQNIKLHETYDFIFIDGDHSYEAVREDLINFLPRLKKNGILALDDYKLPGVKQAMSEVLSKSKLVPFLQAEQTEYWHYVENDRSNFLDTLLTDIINKFIFLYNIKNSNYTILKAKTLEIFTNDLVLFNQALNLYDI